MMKAGLQNIKIQMKTILEMIRIITIQKIIIQMITIIQIIILV